MGSIVADLWGPRHPHRQDAPCGFPETELLKGGGVPAALRHLDADGRRALGGHLEEQAEEILGDPVHPHLGHDVQLVCHEHVPALVAAPAARQHAVPDQPLVPLENVDRPFAPRGLQFLDGEEHPVQIEGRSVAPLRPLRLDELEEDGHVLRRQQAVGSLGGDEGVVRALSL